ncbi:MAG: hypothetical protein ACRC78_01550 [Planktothrix sp.]
MRKTVDFLLRLGQDIEDNHKAKSDKIPTERQVLQEKRLDYLKEIEIYGGAKILERIKKYGCTEKGEILTLYKWHEQAILVLADLRLHEVLMTGAAQIGKTLLTTLVFVDSVIQGRLNVAWIYNNERNMLSNRDVQYYPLLNYWLQKYLEDTENYDIYFKANKWNITGSQAIFRYASTSALSVRRDRAAVGATAASYQADWMVLEERSQYPPGAADVLPRRLDNSKFPARPIRAIGTPGSGAGIETQMKGSVYSFYPHVTCENCGDYQPLHPLGCLLKPSRIQDAVGQEKVSYFSPIGRPNEWFFTDANDPIKTAYFGCRTCGHEIKKETRLASQFACTVTGKKLADFLQEIDPEKEEFKEIKISFELSPLLRDADYNLAVSLIKTGIDTENVADWQQQSLGVSSVIDKAQITAAVIQNCIGNDYPEKPPDFTIAGIDQGRTEDWMIIVDYWLPAATASPYHIPAKTIRRFRFIGSVFRDEIPEILAKYEVTFGLIDNEPSIDSAIKLCEKTVLDMVNQIYQHVPNGISRTKVHDGGVEAECWLVNSNRFMDRAFEAFLVNADDGHPLLRLDDVWKNYLGDQSGKSPARQFMSMFRDTNYVWQRSDKIDHLWQAFHFAEAGFYLKINDLSDIRLTNVLCHPTYNSDLHCFVEDELEKYGYDPNKKLHIGISFLNQPGYAVLVQKHSNIFVVVHTIKSRDFIVMAADIRAFIAKQRSEVLIYGFKDNNGWDLFWNQLKPPSIVKNASYAWIPDNSESIVYLDQLLASGRLYVNLPGSQLLSHDIQYRSVFVTGTLVPDLSNPSYGHLTQILRELVWHIN